jgi:hypothetical protein
MSKMTATLAECSAVRVNGFWAVADNSDAVVLDDEIRHRSKPVARPLSLTTR